MLEVAPVTVATPKLVVVTGRRNGYVFLMECMDHGGS